MKTPARILIFFIVVLGVFFYFGPLFLPDRSHPLTKSIGLPTIDDRSESSINVGKRALVFSKKNVDYDLYELICEKAVAMYGEEDYEAGVEVSKVPDFDLIDGKYSQNQTRAFRIDSRDQYVSIWIVEYAEHVAVVLIQARI